MWELNFCSYCEIHFEICSPAAGAVVHVSLCGVNSTVKDQTNNHKEPWPRCHQETFAQLKCSSCDGTITLAFHLVSTPRPCERWFIIDLKSLCKPLTAEPKGPRGQLILKQWQRSLNREWRSVGVIFHCKFSFCGPASSFAVVWQPLL